MIKKLISIAMVWACTLSGIYAQEALSLESAIEIALKNNLNIKIARNQADISSNNANMGNAGMLPTVGASASTNYSEHGTDEVYSSGSLNFSYTIFDGLNGRYQYQILNAQKEQGALTARYNIETVIANVISQFYSLSKAYDDLQISAENLDVSKDRLQRNQSKYEFGNLSKLEVLNAKVDFNRDSSSYLEAEKYYDESAREMNILLGREAQTAFQLIPSSKSFQDYLLENLKEIALGKNADYLLKISQLNEDQIGVKKAKSAQLPSLQLNSSYSYYENQIAGTNSHTQLSGGLTLSFNIFDGKRKKTNILNAKIQAQVSAYELEDAKLELEKNLVNAYADYQYSRKILHLEEDALEAAQLNFDQTKELYQLGQVNSTTFREAQLNLQEANNKRTAAVYSAKTSEVSLLRISGTLLNTDQ